MYPALQIKIDSYHPAVNKGELLAKIAQHTDDIHVYWNHTEELGSHYCFHTKSLWKDHLDRVRRIFTCSDALKECVLSIDEYEACWHDQCFDSVLAARCEALHGACLLDRYGEGMHRIHEACAHHASPSDRHMVKTLEVFPLTPENHYWTKVVTWQAQRYWYAQQIVQGREGDYESGYHDYISASPHLGPFPAREEALSAGKNYAHSHS